MEAGNGGPAVNKRKNIRIEPAPRNPDTDVKITLPNGRWFFCANQDLLALADRIADWIETGIEAQREWQF